MKPTRHLPVLLALALPLFSCGCEGIQPPPKRPLSPPPEERSAKPGINDEFLVDGVNVQEGAVLHTDPGYPMIIGQDVSIGHQAMLHGCTIGAGSLVGIGAVVLNGAVIGKTGLVGAGALVTERKEFPDNSLIVGVPAKVLRTLSEDDIAGLRKNAADYVARGKRFKTELVKIG